MIFLLGASSQLALALDSQQSPQKSVSLKPCAYQPCPNTPTGEDPAVIDMREQERWEKSLQDGSDDIKRWKSIRLYSDTTEADQLKLSIIKSRKFEMQLIPQKGLVRFSAPEMAVAFRIASIPGSKADVCPLYNLKVVEASSEHAVVRKSCPRYEYAPNRFHMDAEYFLFDWRSLTMRSLWFAVSSSKDAPFPDAKPPIKVVPIANGYRFDWAGLFPDDNSPQKIKISNSYIREKRSNGYPVLVCTDLSAAKGEGRENEMCEGRTLDRVDSATP